jgi:hypothetical protein
LPVLFVEIRVKTEITFISLEVIKEALKYEEKDKYVSKRRTFVVVSFQKSWRRGTVGIESARGTEDPSSNPAKVFLGGGERGNAVVAMT